MAIPIATAGPMDERGKPEMDDSTQSGPRSLSSAPTPATNPIRVLLVDDKVIMREGVRALLEQEPGLHVVAQAASVAEAIAVDARPDVVVTDLCLPDGRGNDVVTGLQRRFIQAAIFALIDSDAPDADAIVAASATAPGVRGYALKTASAAEFLSGVRTVAQGVQFVQSSLRSGNARRTGTTSSGSGSRSQDLVDAPMLDSLTEKEREVLHLLVLGHTNAEIATLSSVSLRTVEARRARLLQKLGVRTRADLVRVAQNSI